MVAHQVEAGRRHQRSELFNQLEGFENDVAGAIAPAALEAIQQLAVKQKLQALASQRSTGDIATEALQPHAVVGRNTDVGVNA